MRQTVSSGSVKAFFLERESLLDILKKVIEESRKIFPEIKEIRLFGTIASGKHTGLSDVDLLIISKDLPDNPLERIKRYYPFFSERIPIAVDIIVLNEMEFKNKVEFHESKIIS